MQQISKDTTRMTKILLPGTIFYKAVIISRWLLETSISIGQNQSCFVRSLS